MTSLQKIKSNLKQLISARCADLGYQVDVEFIKTQSAEHGDFSTNAAMKVAKANQQNPIELATQIVSSLVLPDEIKKAEIAGPGFINFTLSKEFLLETLSSNLIPTEEVDPRLVIVEYSQPNVAKPLGIHHLLSTVIGQSVFNLLKAVGYNVFAWNYIGDWGTQFGKLIYAYKNWGDKNLIEKDPIKSLLTLYVEFHEKAENDPTLEDLGRAEFKKLEEGDLENRKIWEWVIEVSKKDFMQLYELLGGINFDTFSGESSLENYLPELLQEGKDLGIFVHGEKDSFIVNLEKQNLPPLLVQKSDGATLYATRDIASVKFRIQNYNPQKIIYVVDVAQSLHFKQFFAVSKMLPWYNNDLELHHLSFGRMSFKDKKMSTRKGNIIYLEEVISEAIERSMKIIEEKNPNIKNKNEIARTVGIGSLKYSVLMQSPDTNIIFDWDKIITFDGNSAPYLQYTYARAKSILRQNTHEIIIAKYTEFNNDEENILRHFAKFGETVSEAATKYKPNILATYLFELAQLFNSFYAKYKVNAETVPEIRNFRLCLVQKTAEAIKSGLHLLGGIEVVEEL